MKEPASQMSSARRTFLKTAVAAGGVTVLSSTANAAPAEEISQKTVPAAPEPAAESTGYHETPHIKRYYRTLSE